MTSFNKSQLQERISRTWDESIVPSLVEYIKIPNKSPSFEPAWQELGHMEQALQLALEWSKSNMPEKAQIQVKRSAGRTPLLFRPSRGNEQECTDVRAFEQTTGNGRIG